MCYDGFEGDLKHLELWSVETAAETAISDFLEMARLMSRVAKVDAVSYRLPNCCPEEEAYHF